MNQLELALRRYQQIVPQPLDHGRMPLRLLNIWLRENVNSVLEEITRRPTFREHASWPIIALRSGAQTGERGLIDRIDAELVKCAKALHRLASNRLLERKIQEKVPSESVIIGETVEIDAAGARTIAVSKGPSIALDVEWGQVNAIAERDWIDLVNVNDYFEPEQEWTVDDDGRKIQRGAGIVSINPELLPIGNFIVRRMLARIKVRVDVLKSLRAKSLSALQHVRPTYQQQLTEFETSWSELTRLDLEADRVFRTGRDSTLRDACMTATQVYGAFHPDPDLDWLGLDASTINRGIEMLRRRSTGWENAHFFERIAVALGSLKQLYRKMDSECSVMEEAVASGGLVIDTVRNEAFWEGQPLDRQPTGSAWRLLVALARKAPHRMSVEERDIWGDKVVSNSAMATLWGRLKERLPASLWKLVRTGEEPRTYCLKLDGDRIHIIPDTRPGDEKISSLAS
jgi:hypothetical protein